MSRADLDLLEPPALAFATLVKVVLWEGDALCGRARIAADVLADILPANGSARLVDRIDRRLGTIETSITPVVPALHRAGIALSYAPTRDGARLLVYARREALLVPRSGGTTARALR